MELAFGSFASHLAAHVVAMRVSKMVTVLVALGCALGCNEFLFWVPKMVPILGTCFGTLRAHTLFSNNNGRGYEFWFLF